MVLNMDCEPRTYPTEMVTIERVKNELQQELHLPEKIIETDTNYLKDLEAVDYDITPMYDLKNMNYHLIQSLSYDNNKYIKCHWDVFMQNYKHDMKLKINPLKFPYKSEDFYFRFNTIREKPLDECRPLKKMLNGTFLKLMPVPTAPRPIRKYETKTKRGYAADDFLKRHTKPFQGLKKSTKESKKEDDNCC